jgi:CubicO group peptidase (beta-lactamase class C family)
MRGPATPDTIYDCASLTKPLVTGTLILQLIGEGRIALDDLHRGYTFRELLTHTSGLRDWLPLYAYGDPLAAIEKDGPEGRRGERVVYSDLNFVLLYDALQQITGDYEHAARSRIFEPLGLRDACFRPSTALRPRIAATEWGQRWERRMCADRGVAFDRFREGLIWGEVHDGNSFHGGGTLGNAGLFATAREVFRIAQAFARGELVPPELVREATRVHAEDRGLGWQLDFFSPGAYGHTGFTGTSVCVDGERISVLLTNRVHPCAAPTAMKRVRERFHRAAR